MSKGIQGPTDAELTAYLEAEVTPFDLARIEKELAESSSARARLLKLAQVRDALMHPIAEASEIDLVPALRQAILGLPEQAKRKHSGYAWLVAAASVALCVGFGARNASQEQRLFAQNFVGTESSRANLPLTGSDSEFRAKSATTSSEPSRWAGVQVYRLKEHGQPERVSDTIRTYDGLLFSYTNLGREPFDYLMIFGITEKGSLKWFYPAYTDIGDGATSISIQKGEATVPLPELIRHDFATGRLGLHALFSRQKLSIREIETALGAEHDGREALALENAFDHVVVVQVIP